MTRCGDRRCTVPAHLTYGPVRQAHEVIRTDPGYDQPGPPRRSDFSLIVIVQGIVVFLAVVMFCVLASLVEVGS